MILTIGLLFFFFLFDGYHEMVSPKNGDTRGKPPAFSNKAIGVKQAI